MWSARGLKYGVVRVTGLLLILLGLCLLGVGIANVTHTALTYKSENGCSPSQFIVAWGTDPCDATDIWRFTWASAPIWSSVFIVATGTVGVTISPRYSGLLYKRNAYAMMAFISALLFCGATIALSVYDVTAGKNVYYTSESGSLEVRDTAKFVLPIIQAILSFVIMVICTLAILYSCYGVKIYRDLRYKASRSSSRSSRRKGRNYSPFRRSLSLNLDGPGRPLYVPGAPVPPSRYSQKEPRLLQRGNMLPHREYAHSDLGYYQHHRIFPTFSSSYSTLPVAAYTTPSGFVQPIVMVGRKRTGKPSTSSVYSGFTRPTQHARQSDCYMDSVRESIDHVFDFGDEALSDADSLHRSVHADVKTM